MPTVTSSSRWLGLAVQRGLLLDKPRKDAAKVPMRKCGVSLSYFAALAASMNDVNNDDRLRMVLMHNPTTALNMQRFVIPLMQR